MLTLKDLENMFLNLKDLNLLYIYKKHLFEYITIRFDNYNKSIGQKKIVKKFYRLGIMKVN